MWSILINIGNGSTLGVKVTAPVVGRVLSVLEGKLIVQEIDAIETKYAQRYCWLLLKLTSQEAKLKTF